MQKINKKVTRKINIVIKTLRKNIKINKINEKPRNLHKITSTLINLYEKSWNIHKNFIRCKK